MRKFLFLPIFLLVGPVCGDVYLLKNHLMSGDPDRMSLAAQKAATLSASEQRLLVLSLIVPLRQDSRSAAAAARALGYCGRPAEEALPDLIEALRQDDPAVVQAVGETLVKIGPAALPPLRKALEDPNFQVRQRAAQIAGAFGPNARRLSGELAALTLDSNLEVRSAAESAILQIGEPAIPEVARLLRQKNVATRQSAASLLGRLGVPASPALVRALRQDENGSVRAAAATALGTIRPPKTGTVQALIDTLKDFDDTARTAAIVALGSLGPEAKAAIAPLIQVALKDSEPLIKQRAAQALEAIGPGSQESLPGLVDNMKSPDGGIRRASVLAIGAAQMGPEDTSAAMALALKDLDSAVKLSAIEVTASYAPTYAPAVSLLRPVLYDPDKSVRLAAIAAMGRATAAPDAAALTLQELLKDADPLVRDHTVDALSSLGPEAVPALLVASKDSYDTIAQKAQAAIVSMGPAALPALEKASASGDLVSQKEIQALMAQIQKKPAPRRSRKPR